MDTKQNEMDEIELPAGFPDLMPADEDYYDYYLIKAGFTDSIDASSAISLFDYRVVRNPKNDVTIIKSPVRDAFALDTISYQDVLDSLPPEGDGFYDTRGTERDFYLQQHRDKRYATDMIFDLIEYYGIFADQQYTMNKYDLLLYLDDCIEKDKEN